MVLLSQDQVEQHILRAFHWIWVCPPQNRGPSIQFVQSKPVACPPPPKGPKGPPSMEPTILFFFHTTRTGNYQGHVDGIKLNVYSAGAEANPGIPLKRGVLAPQKNTTAAISGAAIRWERYPTQRSKNGRSSRSP